MKFIKFERCGHFKMAKCLPSMMDQTIGFGMMDLRTLPAVWGEKPSRKEPQELGPAVRPRKIDQPQRLGFLVCIFLIYFHISPLYYTDYMYIHSIRRRVAGGFEDDVYFLTEWGAI